MPRFVEPEESEVAALHDLVDALLLKNPTVAEMEMLRRINKLRTAMEGARLIAAIAVCPFGLPLIPATETGYCDCKYHSAARAIEAALRAE